MMSRNTPTIKPQRAIEEYLSALLNPAAKPAQTGPERASVVAEPASPRAELADAEKQALQQTLLRSLPVAPSVQPRTPPAAGSAIRVPEVPATTAPEAPPLAPPAVPVTTNHWLANGRPHWAQERFECLLFNVGGLKLAVPLVCLGGVHAVKDAEDLTPLPGMPDWFLGLMPTVHGNLRVVDTARWVMPERQIQNYAQQMRYVIRISGSEWGLACDAVDKSFRIQPDAVRWRTERSKRPWLAGTLVEQMCAVLDMDALNQLLRESESRKRSRKS